MNWVLERDAADRPTRLVYVGPRMPVLNWQYEPKPKQCWHCGYPSGWHKLGCELRQIQS
jgi:hypothetical protein